MFRSIILAVIGAALVAWIPVVGEVLAVIVFLIVFGAGLLVESEGGFRCPYCGKGLRIGASACHHCGRLVRGA